jgi:AcrR family transcriptional regulator
MTEQLATGWYPTEFVPKPAPKRSSGRRKSAERTITAEDYFGVAMEILAELGSESLTTAQLCDRLQITKGSFYYHFRGIDHFVAAFVAYRETVLNNLLFALASEPDPKVRISSGIRQWAAMPHEAEVSIRAWSRSNPLVAASQERIDRSVLSLTVATLSSLVDDAELVSLTARQLVALMLGLEHLELPAEEAELVRPVLAFLDSACGLDLRCRGEAVDSAAAC